MADDSQSRGAGPTSGVGGPDLSGAFEVGTLISFTYRVEALLARGGMGEVYRTTHTEIGTQHAVKIVRPELASDEKIMELFRREASVLRTIRDDAIVGYDGVLRDEEGRVYLVMEYVDGPSLSEYLKDHTLTPAEVRDLRDRLAHGLAAAHDKGVIHRDMSPDNVILGEGQLSQAKIIDFGIAKLADSSATTIIGEDFAGRYAYASPEQIGLYGGQVDARSDIYSLGLVLATAGTGKALNMGEISESLVSVIEARKRVPDFSSVPESLREELGAMLQPDPADRPQTMRDVIGLDKHLQAPAPSVADTAEAPHPAKAPPALAADAATRPAGGSGAAKSRLWPGLAAAAVLAAAGGYVVWQGEQASEIPKVAERDAVQTGQPAAPDPATAEAEAVGAEKEASETQAAVEERTVREGTASPSAPPAQVVAEQEAVAGQETVAGVTTPDTVDSSSAPETEAANVLPPAIEPPADPSTDLSDADKVVAPLTQEPATAEVEVQAPRALEPAAAEPAAVPAQVLDPEMEQPATGEAPVDVAAPEPAPGVAQATAPDPVAPEPPPGEESVQDAEQISSAAGPLEPAAPVTPEGRSQAPEPGTAETEVPTRTAEPAAEGVGSQDAAIEEAMEEALAQADNLATAASPETPSQVIPEVPPEVPASAPVPEVVARSEGDAAYAAGEEPAPTEQVAALPAPDPVDLRVVAQKAAEAQLSREQKREIQRDLRALGYYRGGIDGSFGPGTRGGIERYQQVAGVAVTGYLSEEQRQALAETAAAPRAEEAARLAAEKKAAEAAAARAAEAEKAAAERKAAEAAAARARALAQQRSAPAQSRQQQVAVPGESEIQRLQRIAEAGDPLAQASLGLRYYRGDGVPRDLQEALRWTKLAAEQGEARAQSNLGFYYMNGEGVRRNPVEAARWWRQAAAQGLPQAQFNMGLLYETGQGVSADPQEAARWYRLAIAQGDRQAKSRLDGLVRRGVIPAEVQ